MWTPIALEGVEFEVLSNRWCRKCGAIVRLCNNAVAESAFSSLKNEFYHRCSLDTCQDARRATMGYIGDFYKWQRPYTHNDGLPPATVMANFKTKLLQLPAAA